MYPGNDDEQVQSSNDLLEKLGDGALSEPLLQQESNIVEVVEEKQLSKWDIRRDKLRRYLEAHFAKAVIGVIWMSINVILFIQHFILYWNSPNFFVSTARGFGQVLNFNCALILIPVLRNAITFLRQTFLHRFIPFDSNIMFHRRIAWTIVVASYGHGMAHYMNYNLQQSPFTFAFGTLAGLTGNLLVFVMVIMYSSAIDAIRRRYFNVFYFAHHLFIVFFILLLLHGPFFWIWFIAPGVIYVIERLMREYRAKKTTTVLEVTNHPSDVIEIKMSKKGFKYKSGQYLYLNAPHISYYEWHPFTITSAPHQEYTSVHIRAVGRWTKKLKNLLGPEEEGSSVELNQFKASDGRAILRLDGPFGAASEEVFDFKTVVLIGAGIGVTPFASILKSLYHKKKANEKCRIEKAYFFWVCREYKAFEWFQTLLRDLELEMKARNDDLISINPFLTAKLSKEELDTLKQNSGGLDPYTGLESSTKLGRPDFGAIFDELKVAHPGEKIGVFFCGPRVLSKTLRQDCMQKSAKSKKDGAKFIFHKENF